MTRSIFRNKEKKLFDTEQINFITSRLHSYISDNSLWLTVWIKKTSKFLASGLRSFVLKQKKTLFQNIFSRPEKRRVTQANSSSRTQACLLVRVALRSGSRYDNSILSTGLIIWIEHRKEIRKLTFRNSNARKVSFRISLRWPIHSINPVDKTKLSCYTPYRRSTTVSLETYSLCAQYAEEICVLTLKTH